MFDKELFYKLCEKYEVELSDKYDKAMIKGEDGIKELNDDEVKKIFYDFFDIQADFLYKESDVWANIQAMYESRYTEYSEDTLPIAC